MLQFFQVPQVRVSLHVPQPSPDTTPAPTPPELPPGELPPEVIDPPFPDGPGEPGPEPIGDPDPPSPVRMWH